MNYMTCGCCSQLTAIGCPIKAYADSEDVIKLLSTKINRLTTSIKDLSDRISENRFEDEKMVIYLYELQYEFGRGHLLKKLWGYKNIQKSLSFDDLWEKVRDFRSQENYQDDQVLGIFSLQLE